MNVKEVVFLINEQEKIILKSPDPLNEISCCYDGLISLICPEQTIILSNDDILESMRIFALLLQKAIDNYLLLDSSLEDIGFVYNQYSYFFWSEDLSIADTFFYEDDGNNGKDWIGMRYHVWMAENNVTWLYNDKNGAIVLKITPFYPYLHTDPNQEAKYIFYEEWVKNYKPFFIRVIPKETALKWLKQANEIIEQIYMNIERWGKKETES